MNSLPLRILRTRTAGIDLTNRDLPPEKIIRDRAAVGIAVGIRGGYSMRTLSVKVSDDVYRCFKKVAEKHGLTPSQLLKQLILSVIEKELSNDSISLSHTYQNKLVELEERLRLIEEKLNNVEKFLKTKFGIDVYIKRQR